MNPLYGPLTTDQRDTLAATRDMLALLPLPGCADLATRLDCIAQTRRPTTDQIAAATALATTVQRTLRTDACPDRWLDELSDVPLDLRTEIAADLVNQRQGQAEQVGISLALLQTLHQQTPITT